jgi:hypothetical protein
MPSLYQQDILLNANDDTLYPEAVKLLKRLVDEEECLPLPASQVAGLLNIAKRASYPDVEQFIRHQRERNWPESRKDVKIFYTALGETLNTFEKKWLPERFQLPSTGKTPQAQKEESKELMALIARDFIQHLVAENMRLLANMKAQQGRKG